MRLVVVSHKPCWLSTASPRGFATDGGFVRQIEAVATLADQTRVCVPIVEPDEAQRRAETVFASDRIEIVPLPEPSGDDLARKVAFPRWLVRALPTLVREVRRADAVHTPVPGDVGTIGIALAELLRRPLLVRYCGNWLEPRTRANRLLRWYMERRAGGNRVMLATGGAAEPPSATNPQVGWIFSTSLTAADVDRLASAAAQRTLGAGPQRLVTVARQESYKGTDTAIEAVADLAATGTDVRFDVVGDGAALPGLRELARRLGVEDRVTFHGQLARDEVLDLLSAAHVFVFPTASEGFPKAVGEAQAAGLPVVATPVSVLPMLIGDDAGVLVPYGDASAVAAAVRFLCDDPERYARASAAAAASGRRYTLDGWAEAIAAHLRAHWPDGLVDRG